MKCPKNGMLITAFVCVKERNKSNGGNNLLHRKRTVILCNPSSQASATQPRCCCKRIVMQRQTDAACSGTVFCLAKCRLCGRSTAGRSSLLKPYLPNSRKLHKTMGTDPIARFFHRYGHFACIFPDTFRIISHRNPVCQAK